MGWGGGGVSGAGGGGGTVKGSLGRGQLLSRSGRGWSWMGRGGGRLAGTATQWARPGAQQGLLTPHPSPRVVHAVQCVDVKILTLRVTRESGRPEVPTSQAPPPPGLAQACSSLTQAPSQTARPHPASPSARSTRQCPPRCCCPPGPPGAHCEGERVLRDCPIPATPCRRTPEAWGLGGDQDLLRGHHIQRESSDCDMGDCNLPRFCLWTVSYSSAQNLVRVGISLGGGGVSCDTTLGEGCHDSQSCDDLKILL